MSICYILDEMDQYWVYQTDWSIETLSPSRFETFTYVLNSFKQRKSFSWLCFDIGSSLGFYFTRFSLVFYFCGIVISINQYSFSPYFQTLQSWSNILWDVSCLFSVFANVVKYGLMYFIYYFSHCYLYYISLFFHAIYF